MAEINGIGKPGRNTAGAIGDIYTDTETGDKFKCTFAFRTGDNGSFESEWKPISKQVQQKKVVKNSVYGEQKKEPVKEPQKPVEEKPPATMQPKRRDYSAYSKRNK